MMRQWFTAREIAELKLSGLPSSEFRIREMAKRQRWTGRERQSLGGGYEYHISSLPVEAQEQIFSLVERPEALESAADHELFDEKVLSPAETKAAARLSILMMFDAFVQEAGCGVMRAEPAFVYAYNLQAGNADSTMVPRWIASVIPSISAPTLQRWRQRRRGLQKTSDLSDRYGNRKGQSVLNRAFEGAVKEAIIGLLKRPHIKAATVRSYVIQEFGPEAELLNVKTGEKTYRPWPTVWSFQQFINQWKEENRSTFIHMTDPDRYKSKYQPAFGQAGAGVVNLNQMWEIDASPADVLLVDGRHSMYACIDVYSRRAIYLVSKTPSTEASLLLIRKAIMAWGVPETIRTDNGSDFKSHRFRHAMGQLEIGHKICRPYTPEGKAYVERVIKTLQHELMPVLPGFTGHNVADRSKIEAQKSFSDRMGESDAETFRIDLTAEQLQNYIDAWAQHTYGDRIHETTGESPNARAQGWAGHIKTIANERALDILLAPIASGGGWRHVTKKGVRIDRITFIAPELGPMIGQRVFLKHDPQDVGRVYVYNRDNTFLCEAKNVNFLGIEREDIARAAKREASKLRTEERRRIREAEKDITPEKLLNAVLREKAEADPNVVTFRPTVAHTSHGLEEAAKATRGFDPNAVAKRTPEEEESYRQFVENFETKETNTVVPFNEEQARFDRALRLEQRLATESRISEDDNRWLANYQSTPEYKTNKMMAEHFGDSYFPKTPNRSPDP